jgi:hypothetical protein
MTNDTLKKQLLGVRLLAQEMADEVKTARHALHSGATPDLAKSLERLDALLEPLLRRLT